ncbi:ATP-binding protein [Stratiformator vulcanicus]|uniref:histidine kinase n=1 Tax=Stratiformator vulcanicus TaxID=2527980 RepID=A0A517QZT8_9PLAN|nr:ATP-binding protein [Stratiformator vulcanicus]QDT37113.1 Sensor protein ZraS [Stratiformator vulcanicus]
MSTATLLVISGADQGARYECDGRLMHIGRGGRNEIRVLDSEVSRRHAMVEFDDDSYRIADLKSSNGTFVNGSKVESHQLVNGDRIRVGRSVILFSQSPSDVDSRPMVELVDLLDQGAPDRSRIVSRTPKALTGTQISKGVDSVVAEYRADLETLYQISEEAVSQGRSMEAVLDRILDLTVKVVGADRGCILLRNPESGGLVPQAVQLPTSSDDSITPVSRSIVDYVHHNGRGVRTTDASQDDRFDAGQSIVKSGIREALCVPMQGRYELCGVLYVDTLSNAATLASEGTETRFSDEQLHLLLTIGRQSAMAVENNRYQEALVKAERLAAMGQTIALISHHIKNILQGVRGGSYLIEMGLDQHDEDNIRKGWGIVERNQDRIYNLVMDMLTFSKERTPSMQIGQVNEVVREAAELMKARADEVGVRLGIKLDEDLPPAMFDSEGIHRAILNIATNAIDAVEGSEKGAVRIETGYSESQDAVYISVVDNGPGIPDDMIDTVFQIFESTKGSRGTGLGLAVSRKILREHGGDIHIETKVGRGARFNLSWPRIDDDHRPSDATTNH